VEVLPAQEVLALAETLPLPGGLVPLAAEEELPSLSA